MSFNRSEFAWNSVDVYGDDGLLHNGRVIDAVDLGLVVDFGGTGHSNPKLVPFGDAYFSDYSGCLHRSGQSEYAIDGEAGPGAEEDDVEILLRLQPHDPWKWYPGRLLQSFGLIRVTLPERELMGVVVGLRIRRRTEKGDYQEDYAVEAGKFSKKRVAVPSVHGIIIPADDQLIAIFNAHCRENDYWMMAIQVITSEHHGKELAVLGIFNYDTDGDMPEDFCNTRRECDQSLDELLLSLLKHGFGHVSSATQYPEGDIQSLHRDPTIFPQIFECLTTVQQNKIRRVCSKWNAILTLPCFRRVVTASAPCYVPIGEHAYSRNRAQYRLYAFTACLYHCWTQQTRMLVVCGPEARRLRVRFGRLAETVRFLQRVMAVKGLSPAPALILSGCWRLSVDALNWVNDLCNMFLSLGSICQQMVLRNPLLCLVCSRQPDPVIMVVSFLNKRMSCPLTVNAFWTMLNNGLKRYSADGMELLAEWITPGSTFFDPIIPQVLNTTQSLDPREGVRYRGMAFSLTADGGLKGVDVEHLTNLTLHTLIQYYKQVIDMAKSARQASEPVRKKQKVAVAAMRAKVLYIR